MEKTNLRKRKIYIGKRTISLLTLLAVILSITVISVSAVAYVILNWTTTATVVPNPKVCFVLWADGTTKANSFDYAVNIFASVRTIDENITYGIWNWDSGPHTVYMRILSITTSGNFANVTTVVKNGAGATQITVTWTGGGFPTAWQSFSALATTKYTIWTELLASGSPAGSSVITYDLKVENP